MSNPLKSQVISLRTGITGNESDPSTASHGVPVPPGYGRVCFFVNGGTSATVTIWWYDGSAWHEGSGTAITGNQMVFDYALGTRMECKLTSHGGGTYAISYQWTNVE